jgi:hypothetical protein
VVRHPPRRADDHPLGCKECDFAGGERGGGATEEAAKRSVRPNNAVAWDFGRGRVFSKGLANRARRGAVDELRQRGIGGDVSLRHEGQRGKDAFLKIGKGFCGLQVGDHGANFPAYEIYSSIV